MAVWRARSRPGSPSGAGTLRAALSHVLAGELNEAEHVLAAAARADSSSEELYLSLAAVYRARGEVGRAIQIHQNLLLRPELDEAQKREALLGLGLDFRAGGFTRRAVASLTDFLEREPRNLVALRALESVYVGSESWVEAIAIRGRIGSADPRTATVRAHLWTALMRAQWAAGEFSRAQRSFRRAVSSDRGCAEPYVVMGEFRLAEGKRRKAIHHWQRALELHPLARRVLYPKLYEAYRAEGDLASFCKLLGARRAAAPDETETILWWARTQSQLGESEAARAALEKLLRDDPDSVPAYVELGYALLCEAKERESAHVFEQLSARIAQAGDPLQCRRCGLRERRLRWRCPRCNEWDSFDA